MVEVDKEEEEAMSNNVEEVNVEEDGWTEVKKERKKEKKAIRQLEEQTKRRPDQTNKTVPTTNFIPDGWCRNCRLSGNLNGCHKMYCIAAFEEGP